MKFISLLVIALLSACSSVPVAKDAAKLDVSIEWTDKSGCSLTSPPIHIKNAPKETKFIDIYMVDLDFTSFRHGGGVVAYDGSGLIKEGALNSYKGPCPQGTHRYEFTVDALNADKSLIIGQGKTVKKYPE